MDSLSVFKRKSLASAVAVVSRKLGCGDLEAVSKMQATAARNGNESLLEDLCAYKNILIEDLQ